jgi:hypothetical protein
MGRAACTPTIDLVVDSRTWLCSSRALQHCERAYTTWLAKILPVHRHPSEVAASTNLSPTVAELMKQRETAIENMVASIAAQDGRAAWRHSHEENRLNKLLRNLQNEKSVEHSKIVC